jgi:anti-sigma regulatory factor (Ser/Thr protein kinase)
MNDEHPPCLELRVGGTGADFEGARLALSRFLEAAGIDARAASACELVFEEIVVNVLRHGGDAPAPSGARVDVRVQTRPGELRLDFVDAGPPFDPTSHPEPPRPASIEEAPIGGLGILLVRRTASRFDYRRVDGLNRVGVTIATR